MADANGFAFSCWRRQVVAHKVRVHECVGKGIHFSFLFVDPFLKIMVRVFYLDLRCTNVSIVARQRSELVHDWNDIVGTEFSQLYERGHEEFVLINLAVVSIRLEFVNKILTNSTSSPCVLSLDLFNFIS